MTFSQIHKHIDWQSVTRNIHEKNDNDVIRALEKTNRDIEDFASLISPAASKYLEQMAVLSNQLTQKRFGKTIQLYIPLYLSNECTNHCVYCGFNHNVKIDRITLNDKDILNEIKAIKLFGYEHILLVTGEHTQKAGIDYLKHVVELVKPYFSLISLEVQPLSEDEYKELTQLGVNTVYIYQETYNENKYPAYHPKGKKSNFKYRLETPDRLGKAGIHRIGLACLLGLEDWRTDSFFTAMHLKYLEKKYWKTKYSISFPRLRPHEGNYLPDYPMSDAELLQLICAYRIFDEEVELSISVRESSNFRDNIIKLGITSMSAGSRTKPGGYSLKTETLEQFEVHDNRTPEEIKNMIKSKGYEAVWKDWDNFLQ